MVYVITVISMTSLMFVIVRDSCDFYDCLAVCDLCDRDFCDLCVLLFHVSVISMSSRDFYVFVNSMIVCDFYDLCNLSDCCFV